MKPEEIKDVIREEIRSSMKELMNEIKDEMIKQIEEKCEEKINEVREEINAIREEQKRANDEGKNDIGGLWHRMDKMEEYSRKENIVIRGIEDEEDETMNELVSKVKRLRKN